MKREISFDNDMLDYFSNQRAYMNEPDSRRERMKKILRVGIENELTQRQRDCLTMRFLENKKVEEIADILCIRPATVYKHIEKALERLKKCQKYL